MQYGSSRLFFFLAFACALAGCQHDTTGVILTIDGSQVMPEQLRVTAVSSRATVARLLPGSVDGAISMPVSMIAELPPVADTVVFEVEALRQGVPLLAAQSSPIDVQPHELAHGSVTLVWPLLANGNDDAPPAAGSDGGGDSPASGGSGGVGTTSTTAGDMAAPPTPAPPLYAMTVLADAPLAYYRLGEAAGTNAADSSARKLVALYGAGVTRHVPSLLAAPDALADGAASFAGGAPPNGVVHRAVTAAPASTALQPDSIVSVELWMKRPALGVADQVLLSYDSSSQYYAPYVLALSNDALQFTVKTDSASVNDSIITSRTPLAANTVYHVVATYDGSAMSLYINGVLDSRKPVSGHLVYGDSTSGLAIGGTFTSAPARPSFVGVIDEVALYGVALQAPRVMQHYRVGAGLVAQP